MSFLSRIYIYLGPIFVLLPITPLLHAQSMMLKNSHSPTSEELMNRGDFNHDGILDIVAMGTDNNGNGSIISVFPGRADGTFAPPANPVYPEVVVDFAVADFNGDGKLDLALVNRSGNIDILIGNGAGTFHLTDTLIPDHPAVSLTTSDFNNDGKMDLALAEGTPSTNEVQLLRGNGNGTFSNAGSVQPLANFPVQKVRVGDFNRDGKVDIVLLQNDRFTAQSNAVTALFGNGDFTFSQVVLNHYTKVDDLSTGDINQDGFTDILVSFGNDIFTLSGGVDGYFGSASHTMAHLTLIAPNAAFNVPGGMIAADVDGDGINDIVAIGDSLSTVADGLFVWMGKPDGTFDQTPVEFIFTTDRIGGVLVAGDFNRDGKIDFAASNTAGGELEVLLNATPRAPCQKNTANRSLTVCQPQDATISNSPLHVVAEGNSSSVVTDINVYIDNALKGQFAASSIDQFFSLPMGDHFVVVKGFDSTGASFRSDRHVTLFDSAPGETCATGNTVLAVTLCLPEQNAVLSSPVQIFANSYSPRFISAIQVYIDNQLVFSDSTTASAVNKLFSLAAGSHFIVAKAWDATGQSVTDSRTINV